MYASEITAALSADRCRAIDWILSDVDGVMTDGGVIVNDRGENTVRFHIRDGLGVRLWRESGKRFGVLTGRNIEAVRRRAQQLHVDAMYLGADDKLAALESFLASHKLAADRVCYLGDDLLDLPVFSRVGLAMTVADAPTEVQQAAHYVTSLRGGEGAVREGVEVLLRARGEWESVLAKLR